LVVQFHFPRFPYTTLFRSSIVILGVDLRKNACSVVGVDVAGAVIVRRSMRRQTLIDYVAKLPTCIVAMEACCGAHHLGRVFAAQDRKSTRLNSSHVKISYA